MLVSERWRWRRTGRSMSRREHLPLPLLRCIVDRHSFEHKAHGRRPGQTDSRHHYRRGVPGDWRNYFTPHVKNAFKERYGEIVIQLGYEKSQEW